MSLKNTLVNLLPYLSAASSLLLLFYTSQTKNLLLQLSHFPWGHPRLSVNIKKKWKDCHCDCFITLRQSIPLLNGTRSHRLQPNLKMDLMNDDHSDSLSNYNDGLRFSLLLKSMGISELCHSQWEMGVLKREQIEGTQCHQIQSNHCCVGDNMGLLQEVCWS